MIKCYRIKKILHRMSEEEYMPKRDYYTYDLFLVTDLVRDMETHLEDGEICSMLYDHDIDCYIEQDLRAFSHF